ncbi:dihydrofolate reductase [Arenibacter aquaticus]|uniref:Dihydrofolate reductase n=1 Tax=Arenibacter aquaticus TaxID=2489054 RepID=A0A3S0ILJ9_9FLAO|nr:dihydrofolate reductase [Arenibacter aquaticus]RTE52902.1 dihydrofolate reductase [Arenibacter aquaticus]
MNTLTIIAAAAENNALGKNNDLLWHLPDDFKRFKSLTSGHKIIMGRKTFESFPKPLPNRTHIIITRDKDYEVGHADCMVVHSMDEALALVKEDPLAFIIGGGEIYKIGMEYANHMELTRVHGSFEADTFFPDFDEDQWELTNKEHHPKDERHKYDFTYLTYIKK